MIDKWADFLISKVRHDPDPRGSRIVGVHAHKDKGETAGTVIEMDRDTLLVCIANGYTFATVRGNGDGLWRLDTPVQAVKVDDQLFVRVENADRKLDADDLGNLPTF